MPYCRSNLLLELGVVDEAPGIELASIGAEHRQVRLRNNLLAAQHVPLLDLQQ